MQNNSIHFRTLDEFCDDGCKFYHVDEGFMLMPNEQIKGKVQQKGLCKASMNTTYLL